jgi:hypothetical protein
MLIMGSIMVLTFLAVGVSLLLNFDFVKGVPESYRGFLGTVILLYGAYRGWRIYSDYA